MIPFRALATVLALGLPVATGRAQDARPNGERPRLVVVCVVDQLASWVLEQALPHCGDGGFRRLLAEGTWFRQCAYQHGCTETGPGHATLGTGAPAMLHGIVKNEWFDAASRTKVYCASDPEAEALPEFPEGKGRGPARLLLPTLGDGVKAHLAGSKVVSVSVKDRSAILLAGRAADAVVWFETRTGRFVTNARFGDAAPPWLLELDAQHPANAYFGWTWDRFAPDEAYARLVDDRPFELPHASGGGRTLPVTITGGRREEPSPAFWNEAYLSPIGNELVLQVAEAATRGAELGRDDAPDLLCVSFSCLDTVGHVFGSDSVEARDTLLRIDALLAGWFERLDRDVGAGRWTFLLSSDHGVGPTPEQARAAGVAAGRGPLQSRARAAAEAAIHELLPGNEGRFVVHVGEQSLFLDHEAIAGAAARAVPPIEAAAAVRDACAVAATAARRVPGMMTTFVTAELLANGPGEDPLRRAMWFAVHPGRSGDVLLVFEPYWLEGMTPASHGTPHAYDREVPLLAMGARIARGVACDVPVSPGLIAVLGARVLGVPPPTGAVDAVPPGVIVR